MDHWFQEGPTVCFYSGCEPLESMTGIYLAGELSTA